MGALLAFHADVKVKNKYLKRVHAHAKADEIVKGKYWQDGKGCAVGCTIHSDQHSSYETELGIPQMLAQLEDVIFEGTSNEYAKTWPEKFLKAIKPGVDLSKVGWKFQHWLLLDLNDGVFRFAREEDKAIITEVAGLLWDLALGKPVTESAAWSAASAARSAASATRSAAYERQGEYLLKLLKETK